MEAVKVKFYCFWGIVNPTVYNTVGEPDYESRTLNILFLTYLEDNGNHEDFLPRGAFEKVQAHISTQGGRRQGPRVRLA